MTQQITLQNITKTFYSEETGKQVTALDNLSLRLPKGEMIAFIGPSGCGKSTLLRIVAGLTQPDSGTVYYDKTPLSEIPMEDRGIGMVFQEGALMPHWRSRQTIGFFYRLRQREVEVPERVKQIAQITGLGMEKLMERRPRQLSGGEKQRVAVARALTRDLKLLLFDEPFSNLDTKLRSNARIELKRLLRAFPTTSIYVTHDQDEAVTLGDRIAVMNAGHIEQIGNYDYLYNSPVNLFVAQFFGNPSMNFFDGVMRDGHWYGENFGGYLVRRDFDDGHPVVMGLRPQHFYLKAGGVAGVVDAKFPLLPERRQLVNVWLGDEKWSLLLDIEEQITLGETIYCDLDPTYAHFFDKETGLRIG
jgi:multiple sugar transport system ATP-binding protein